MSRMHCMFKHASINKMYQKLQNSIFKKLHCDDDHVYKNTINTAYIYNYYGKHYIMTDRRTDGLMDLISVLAANCDNAGHIIGENTGLYIGGLPDDFIFQRPLLDVRAEVSMSFLILKNGLYTHLLDLPRTNVAHVQGAVH